MRFRESEIQEFLESGLLEQYALGLLSDEESTEVQAYIADSDTVRDAYVQIQETLEAVAADSAVDPPSALRGSVLSAIDSAQPFTQATAKSATIDPSLSRKTSARRLNRLVVAASIAVLVFATVAIAEWNRAYRFGEEVARLSDRVKQLEAELDAQQVRFTSLETKYDEINDPSTQKVVLVGNTNAPEFQVVAYWNKQSQTSYLQVVDQPNLPNEQCFQLWADVHGEMINLGVIPDEQGLITLDFKVDAESLNVTIEPKGGSEHPTVSRLVASISI